MSQSCGRKIEVRPIGRQDLNRLLEILRGSFKKEIEIGGFDFQRFERNARLYRMTKFLMPVFDFLHKDYPNILVATLGDKVVGEVHIVPLGNRIWTIDSLATDSAYAGQGVGYHLIKGSVEYAAKRGAKNALSSIRTDNTPALKIAEKLGFTPYQKTTVLFLETQTSPRKELPPSVSIRKFQSTDAEEVFKIYEAVDPTKTQAYGIKPKTFQTSTLERLLNKMLQTHSEKLVIAAESNIVGYAHVTYTSPKEAARIESLCILPNPNHPQLTQAMLTHILTLLKEKNITKVTISLDEKRQNPLEALKQLGFRPIASFCEIAKQLD